MASDKLTKADLELADEIQKFYGDPLGFVTFAFPWGEKGSALEDYQGPDKWQRQVLEDVGAQVRARRFDGVHAVEPIRVAVSSGHGTGKSVLSAWLANWIMSTRPFSQGTITANTFTQLQTKTWAALQRWFQLSITARWFDISNDRVRAKASPSSWFCSAQTCKEENSESFAGQHAANSTSWYLLDESSAIPDIIWDVAEGGMTDGEPMIFAFGNATRSSGRFYQVCWGGSRARWHTYVVDSREARFTNKTLINQWIEDFGEDSDFVRVRVRGLPPAASDNQFIDSARVSAAQNREAAFLADDPLIAGLDVARGGGDNCVIRFRRGMDARSIKPIVIPGEEARDSMRLVSAAGRVLEQRYYTDKPVKVAMMFVDETGVGGPIVDRLRQLGHDNVVGVSFGAKSPDPQHENMRSHMWAKMRDWLLRGSIDRDSQLEVDLTGPGFSHTKRDKLLLESKESMKARGLASPDHGDALGLTFAQAVMPTRRRDTYVQPYRGEPGTAWMG